MGITKILLFTICVPTRGLQGASVSLESSRHFWNIDPYCLESICACFVVNQDASSVERLLFLFPQLSQEDVPIFAKCILASRDTDYLFSDVEEAIFSKLVLPKVSLSSKLTEDLVQALVLMDPSVGVQKARYYSLYLDVLALRAYVERERLVNAACKDITRVDLATIEAINTILFQEEGLRYPAKKEMFESRFSELAAVADSKFGVCLGSAVLYQAVAQRLDLSLEAVTPPGHIYLRYKEIVNIETTSGGRHIPTERYCEYIKSSLLRVRSQSELIGLTFMNRGAFFLQKGEFLKASQAYEKAKEYLSDEQILDLLGITYILSGRKREGESLLKKSTDRDCKGSVVHDYLQGYISSEALGVLFIDSGTTYQETLAYRKKLLTIAEKFPKSCSLRLKLAATALELGLVKEGVSLLEQSVNDAPEDLSLRLQFCKILCDRCDYVRAKQHFDKAEEILSKEGLLFEESSYTFLKVLRKKMALVAPNSP
ncbi:MAG: hypothetical protein IJ490_02905 [Chlamydia sp.]|nr:hypothetical protein [Chlamydia sp.]